MNRLIWEKLLAWQAKSDKKPLILKGARQVGKTYILKEFGQQRFQKSHILNFEKNPELSKFFDKNLDPKRILKELALYLETSIDPAKDLLIFDEIQYCPKALTSLKYFEEDMKGIAIAAAGSLLGIHLNHDESFPVGKVDFLEMYPMSFEEFLRGTGHEQHADYLSELRAGDSISDPTHDRIWDLFKNYLVVGGLPEVVNTFAKHGEQDLFSALTQAREKQEALILAFQADIAKHSGKQNSMHIERVWKSAQIQIGKEQDGSAPKFQFNGVIPGVKGYQRLAGAIDWLVKAGLLIKSHMIDQPKLPFSAYSHENSFKLYHFDVGILGAMAGLPPKTLLAYDYGTYKGYFAENFVAQEFLCSGAKELYFWKDGHSEVEFIREVDGDILPIEVKSGWVTKSQSLKKFVQKYPVKYRVMMSAKPPRFDNENKIHHYPLYLAYRFPL